MPYTKARLEHALKAFRETLSNQSRGGLGSRSLAHNLRSYHLRSPQKIIYDYGGTSRRGRGAARESDDEYNPTEERRQINAAAAKRKKTTQKRKANEEGDTERKIKRSKRDTITANSPLSAYVTLKFTTEEGKKLLSNLASIHGKSHPQQRHHEEFEPDSSYWKPDSNSRRLRGGFYTSDIEQGRNHNDVEELTVGLRNGKVPNKQINLDRKSKSKNISQDLHEEDIQDATETYNDDTIYGHLSSDEVKVTSSFSKSKEHIEEGSAKSTKPQQPKQPQLTLRKVDRAKSYTDGAGLISMPTHYAHPINFKSIQTPCHFCGNWRMGVIGLGKRVVSFFKNPSDPTKLEEAGNGWRAENFPATEMCLSCGLKKLKMARCHAPEPEDEMRIGSSQPERHFTLITSRNYSNDELNAYIADLFDSSKRPVQFQDLNGKGFGLPYSCSLCPSAAYWRCCKVQEHDMIKDQCTSLPVKIDYKVTQETIDGKKRDVLCLDSDNDDDDKVASLPPAKKRRTANRTPTPIRFPPMASLRSPAPVLLASRRGLGSGCGLKLCNYCKAFLEGQCNGKLNKAKVWNYLRGGGNKFGARADVEFLFRGSDLELAHAGGDCGHDPGM